MDLFQALVSALSGQWRDEAYRGGEAGNHEKSESEYNEGESSSNYIITPLCQLAGSAPWHDRAGGQWWPVRLSLLSNYLLIYHNKLGQWRPAAAALTKENGGPGSTLDQQKLVSIENFNMVWDNNTN